MKYFGTDGIRKKADEFTPEFLTAIVKGLINYAGDNIKVLIGGDTRESTEWILRDLESALETFGIEYGNVGILPTPAINYCFPKMGFDFAIDVTASHNLYIDNGIKIFELDQNGEGTKICKKGREIIEKTIDEFSTYTLLSPSIHEDLHRDAIDIYKDHLLNYVGKTDFSNLNIGMDCANGATSAINKTIFEKLSAKVKLINSTNSYNTKINDGCGSTHLEPLINLVKEQKLDYGIAFDGDGDRVLMIDENGDIVDGDQIIAILVNYLNLESFVTTVMANQGLLNWAKDNNLRLEIAPVGDYNVARIMREKNIPIGGEQSGHIILPNEATGDGILTALMISKVISSTKKSLGDLAKIIAKYPQVNVTIDATPAQKTTLATSDAVRNILTQFEKKVNTFNGRLLVRPSGTEDLIRISIWGDNENEIKNLAEDLKNKLGETL